MAARVMGATLPRSARAQITLVAGLMPFDRGEVLSDGKTLRETAIGHVSQNDRDALFPWKRAIDNIRYPDELSGGQQPLVSIMRALAPEPEVLFLDEPLSAFDYEMTLFIRERLQQVFMETGTTMALVSHDLEDAVWLADTIVLPTRRPTGEAEVPRFGVPRPRDIATLTDPAFTRSKAHALQVFQSEVREAEGAP